MITPLLRDTNSQSMKLGQIDVPVLLMETSCMKMHSQGFNREFSRGAVLTGYKTSG
jgi:hypothetical protein